MGGTTRKDCGCARGPGLGARPVALLTAALDLLVPRLLLRAAIALLLLARGLFTSERLRRFWERQFLCPPGAARDAQGAFLERFHEALLSSGSFERLVGHVRAAPRWRLACRLESFARVTALARLRHFLLSGGDGPPPLSEIHLACCTECDQACLGCYSACDRSGATPDPARLGALVDDAARCGAVVVHVLGKGEPFLDERRGLALLEVVAARRHLYFTLATSALHLTEALAAAVARTDNLLLLVSVDGPPDVHEARRGAGTWPRVRDAMDRLAARGALFAFSCTVAASNWREAIAPSFVARMREAGCSLGVYSRFFSVQPGPSAHAVPVPDLPEYRALLAGARRGAGMPLIDLDELEAATGCRARAGLSVYVDGTTGRVLPCIRLPWAPQDCRLGGAPHGELARVLAHPFYEQYRRGGCADGCWCGSDLASEQQAVRACAEAFDRR